VIDPVLGSSLPYDYIIIYPDSKELGVQTSFASNLGDKFIRITAAL
jgi:hypothetical protein